MKILLLGKNGQVGYELQRSLSLLGEVVALDRHGSDGLCGDLTQLDALRSTIRKVDPEVIVNAAAYTAVDRAEDEKALAACVNADAPRVLAEEALQTDTLLVHYSTDYVFSGAGDSPWIETDLPAPVNHYGTTKLAGEWAIAETGCRHLTFRTSWVYAPRRDNFMATMVRLIQERETLKVVSDQIGAPTPASLIADVTAHTIVRVLNERQKTGTYHLAPTGQTSWHEYAVSIAAYMQSLNLPVRAQQQNILTVPTSEYPTVAVRPKNSRLGTDKLEQAFGLRMPNWKQELHRVLDGYLSLLPANN